MSTAVCTPTPTLTRTVTETTTSFTTSSTTSITTLPDSVTFTTSTCPPAPATTGSSTGGSLCIPSVQTITVPGNTSTFTIPVTIPVDVFITDTTTLFGTVCSTVVPPSDTATSSTTSPTLTGPNPGDAGTNSTLTPSTTPTDTTPIITPPASDSQPPSPSNTLQNPPSSNNEKSNIIGPIVGGVIGGLAVLILLGFFTLRFIKKQHRFDNLFNDKDDDKNSTAPFRKGPLDSDFNLAYNYNPVGKSNPPTGITPPSSPPPGHSTLGNSSGVASGSGAHHVSRPSVAPLLGGAAAALEFGSSNGAASSSSSYNNGGASVPSTVSSHHALMTQTPMSAGNVQPQGYYAASGSSGAARPMSYPPTAQPPEQVWNPATLYGASSSSSSGAALSSNPSMGSMATGVSSWGAPSATTNATRRSSVQAGFAPHSHSHSHSHAQVQVQQPHQQPQMLYTQYEDPFARSGSPVSFQEQRTLQVVNAEPSSPSTSSYALQPPPTSQMHHPPAVAHQPYHVTNLSAIEQEGVGLSGAMGVGAGVGANVRVDGKGRPVKDEKPPAVHLNGALYQDPEGPGGPAPPAYQL